MRGFMRYTVIVYAVVLVLVLIVLSGCATNECTEARQIRDCKVAYLNSHLHDLSNVEEDMNRKCE